MITDPRGPAPVRRLVTGLTEHTASPAAGVVARRAARAAGRLFAGQVGRQLLPALRSWQLERITLSSVPHGCRRRTELILTGAACTRRCR